MLLILNWGENGSKVSSQSQKNISKIRYRMRSFLPGLLDMILLLVVSFESCPLVDAS